MQRMKLAPNPLNVHIKKATLYQAFSMTCWPNYISWAAYCVFGLELGGLKVLLID